MVTFGKNLNNELCICHSDPIQPLASHLFSVSVTLLVNTIIQIVTFKCKIILFRLAKSTDKQADDDQ